MVACRKMPRLKTRHFTPEEKVAIIASPTKECPHCNQILPKEAFDINLARFDGKSYICNSCTRKRWKERYAGRGREYYQKHRRKRIDYAVSYNKTHPEVRKNYEREKEQVIYKAEAHRLKASLKTSKARASEAFKPSIGCSNKQLAAHIESKWKPGMTWDNYNFQGWHIDHIIPAKAYDLTNSEQRNKYRHYTNLQPLWKDENLAKAGSF